MPRPATVEKELQKSFEALKAEGRVPSLKTVADKAGKKSLVWSKYPALRREIQQYAAAYKKVEEKKKVKSKGPSKTCRKKIEELEEKLRRTTNFLEASLETINNLQRELEIERSNVKNLR
jgi:hypothetical protein